MGPPPDLAHLAATLLIQQQQPSSSPRKPAVHCARTAVGVLLYRKHVITQQPYVAELIECLEEAGLRPVPIFINGVEAHTVVSWGSGAVRDVVAGFCLQC